MLTPLHGDYYDERQVIEEAINIALARGWKVRSWEGASYEETIVAFDVWKYGMRKVTFFNDAMTLIRIPVFEMLFNHDFARHIFGEREEKAPLNLVDTMTESEALAEIARYMKTPDNILDWTFHIQQMAISKKPIQYLAHYLVKNNMEAPADA